MIDIQEYSVPEKIAEARKWKIVRLVQAAVASAIRRRLAATSDEQSSAAPPCPPSLPACRDFSSEHPNPLVRWKQNIVFFLQLIWPLSKLPANRKQLFRTQVVLLRIYFLSGLSLALNKEGCDWQDRHSSRANSGRATHLSQTRYTPLVEVNQAIKAWSF